MMKITIIVKRDQYQEKRMIKQAEVTVDISEMKPLI